jgi:copper(I)-binding protein
MKTTCKAIAVSITFVALFLSLAGSVYAQSVKVNEAWIRGTVQGQNATGAFMELTSKSNARLVNASSPAAKTVEVHNMKVEGGVMKMYPVDGVDLPAGKTVKLAPGGYHVMLMGLNAPLQAGRSIPVKLTFELADKKRETIDLNIEVRDIKGSSQPEQKGHRGH